MAAPRKTRKQTAPTEAAAEASAAASAESSSSPKPAPKADPQDKPRQEHVEVLPASPDYQLRNDDGEALLDGNTDAPDPYGDYDPEADPITEELLTLHKAQREAPENDSREARQAHRRTSRKGRGKGTLRQKHARKANQPTQDWKLVILQQAYDLVVREGKSVREAAKQLQCRHSLLVYYARKGHWMAARLRYEELDDSARHAEDILTQAEDTHKLLLEKVKQCRLRLDLFEQALRNKVAVITCDVEPVTFTTADGKQRTMFVAKASMAEIADALDVHGELMKQIENLAKLAETRVLTQLRRTQRNRASLERRRSTKETELLALHPVTEATPPGDNGDASLVSSPVDEGVFTTDDDKAST